MVYIKNSLWPVDLNADLYKGYRRRIGTRQVLYLFGMKPTKQSSRRHLETKKFREIITRF